MSAVQDAVRNGARFSPLSASLSGAAGPARWWAILCGMLARVRNWLGLSAFSGGLHERAISHYRRGVELFDRGRFKQAEREFTAALELATASTGLFQHRGAAFAEQGKHLEAIADYDTAIRLRPDYPDAYVDRGNSNHALGRSENALKDYSEAIRLRPDYGEAFANRAALHAEMGDSQASTEDAARARALGIDSTALKDLLSAAAERAGQGGEP
ncbi:MAG: tetratricopeptide repeat protein [Dehalococcoidia bacterium]